MNLSAFITDHLENILAAREAAGHDRPELPAVSSAMTRERTRQLLRAVARETAATAYLPAACTHTAAQCLAVQDGTPLPARCPDCAQGALRHFDGATLAQLSAEFGLLRAVVLGLWLPYLAELAPEAAHELLRFTRSLTRCWPRRPAPAPAGRCATATCSWRCSGTTCAAR
jgi:hypothetical protein